MCLSVPARSAARRIRLARIVDWRRPPASPQKAGSSAAAPRLRRSRASSRASCAGSGWRRGRPPLPARTRSDGGVPCSSRSAQSSAINSERRSPVVTSASSTSRSRSARPVRARSGEHAASSSRANSSDVSQSASCWGFLGAERSRKGSGIPARRLCQRLLVGPEVWISPGVGPITDENRDARRSDQVAAASFVRDRRATRYNRQANAIPTRCMCRAWASATGRVSRRRCRPARSSKRRASSRRWPRAAVRVQRRWVEAS